MDKLTKALGKNIKLLRKSRNLLQSELAEKIGVESKYLSRLETGLSSPSLKTLQKISEELNIDMSCLFDFPTEQSEEEIKLILSKKINLYNINQLRLLSSLIKIVDLL
jgi:transcriptional regulator with XRE-family HTH domain